MRGWGERVCVHAMHAFGAYSSISPFCLTVFYGLGEMLHVLKLKGMVCGVCYADCVLGVFCWLAGAVAVYASYSLKLWFFTD